MEENNIFTGKTLDEAINNACLALELLREELDIEVLEEGKKKLFGSIKWKIKAVKKKSDGDRAAEYVTELLKIMGIEAECTATTEENAINIEIQTEDTSRVTGKRGEILDAIQCLAGAVANIGRKKYAKVFVDCENYREKRQDSLVSIAGKMAKKAAETGRKVILKPMNAYERRIIHSALSESEEVKTVSEGKEPNRCVVIIPNNLKEDSKPLRFGERSEKRGKGKDKRFEKSGARGERRPRAKDGGSKSSQSAKRGKEIHLGTFLGNSGTNKTEE